VQNSGEDSKSKVVNGTHEEEFEVGRLHLKMDHYQLEVYKA